MLTVLANVPRLLLYGLILSLLVVAGYQWYRAGENKTEYETNLQLKNTDLLDAKQELQNAGQTILTLRNDTLNKGIKIRKMLDDEKKDQFETDRLIDSTIRANRKRNIPYGRAGVLDALSTNRLLRQSDQSGDSRPAH